MARLLLKLWKQNRTEARRLFLLSLVLLLFLGTRLYKTSEIPGSVYWDEASIGYNAFAMATDLKDEWGEFLPLHFRAFGEFKLPVYIYSVAVLTKIFGLSELTVRLPAVFYTLGAIIIFYLLVSKVTANKIIGLLSAFILSVSPWLFIFSRTGYEVTAGLFFFLLFVYFLILFLVKKVFIFPAAMAAILTSYSYNSFRILVPFAILVFIAYLFSEKKKVFRESLSLLVISSLIFVISLLPAIKLFYLDVGSARLRTVSATPSVILNNYFSHFDFNFLFLEGDENIRHQQPGWGELYLIELPFILIGLWSILRNKNKLTWLFLVFLIMAPLPAAIAKESPHALRAIVLAPAFAGVAAIGIWSVSKYFKKQKGLIIFVVVLGYLLSFESYLGDFIQKYNQESGSHWQIEYKKIFTETREGVVTDEYAQPYIFALFYLKYPPQDFRNTVKYNPPDKWGFSTVSSLGNFEFKSLK